MRPIGLITRLLLLLALICAPAPEAVAQKQDIGSRSEKKRKIEEEIKFIDGQLKTLEGKERSSQQGLALIMKKAGNRKALIAGLDAGIAEADSSILAGEAELARLQAAVDTLRGHFGHLVYNTYKNREPKLWLMYVLASENIGQGYRRMAYLHGLSDKVNHKAAELREQQALVEMQQERLRYERDSVRRLRGAREAEYRKLLDEEKASRKTIDAIAKDRQNYLTQLKKKQKEVAALNREIERLVREQQERERKERERREKEKRQREEMERQRRNSTAKEAKKGSGKGSGTEKRSEKGKKIEDDEVRRLGGSFEQNRGKLPWPVKSGVVTESFGIHYHPVYKNIKLPENNGVTISTTLRAEVRSVFEGTVRQIIMMPGYNHCVLIQHGEYYTFYCKLGKVDVKAGQKVKGGDRIGTLEPDGGTSSLHFQIWKGTSKQNPEKWLRP